ncbi:hypothetical protein [Nocardia sp. NPDC056100]|uniref:hypothetical protein n=1 Tax=Nocardia sp. NPDC056100 TaxID=3345712 RepID=UPI0035DA471B
MAQMRESATANTIGAPAIPADQSMPLERAAADRHSRAMHLMVRLAPGLSDSALADLAIAADRLRGQEGLPPIEFTAQW